MSPMYWTSTICRRLCYNYRERSKVFKGWLIDIDTCAIINGIRASKRRVARGKPEQTFFNSQRR